MNIGDAATASGLPVKTIRYYEDIGLITPQRTPNGYRSFEVDDLHRLTFLARARSLGFSIEQCRELLELYSDKERSSADVKRIARAHLDVITQKLFELAAMQATLSHLIEHCHGDERPECRILDELSAPTTKLQ